MPKTASPIEKSNATLTFFVGLAMFGFFFLAVGYYWLIQEVKLVKTMVPVASTTPTQELTMVSYDCAGAKAIQAAYFNGRVEITLSDGRTFMLQQGMSASGTRYVNDDETVTFWSKGNTAFVEEKNTQTYKDCLEKVQASPAN